MNAPLSNPSNQAFKTIYYMEEILSISQRTSESTAETGIAPARLLSGFDVGKPDTVPVPLQPYSAKLDSLSCLNTISTGMDKADEIAYSVAQPRVYHVNDAVIHTQYGLLEIGNIVARESTFHFPNFLLPEFKIHGVTEQSSEIFIPRREIALEIETAYSMLCGIQENYYHWVMLFLGRINDLFFNSLNSATLTSPPVLLFPRFLTDVHRQSANVIAKAYGLSYLSIEQDISIRVKNLIYPTPLRSGGIYPNFALKDTFRHLKKQFYKQDSKYPKNIYISRRDTNNRKIANEEALELYLSHRGFTILTLTGSSIKEQVNYFAHADKVIAAHGAGLTNLGFCSPGAKVLEIHTPSYLTWCYRRLAAVCDLKYGFFIATPVANEQTTNISKIYEVDIDNLANALNSGF